ncbi:hypothetical protein GRI38_08410 [Altererythrobacter aurantiacus]|uniref:DAGKc domain-containing protein n=1 Tax=Parapontixanthobacter aurantiacus TaxID=1463599 RepID=A0A844ZE43_9SPHN|nr:diacylglycerol kinase family protein [Parapontixanthobacter aurantiacus]MXO86048.1 hypothetical protein [Parapontixanthobacter aurantiacus]
MDRNDDIDGPDGQPVDPASPDRSSVPSAAQSLGATPGRREARRYWDCAADEAARIGIIFNPKSHGNRKRSHETALAHADRDNIALVSPVDRDDIRQVLREFAEQGIDYLIVDGGDGTVRDVLTAGMPVFEERWPALAVLPRGKTNALTDDLGIPEDWTVADAVSALENGFEAERRPLIIARRDGMRSPVAGFIMGAGSFTTGVRVAQDAHRLGAFGGLAVALTAVWGALQTIFGTNRNDWRRGVAIDIRLQPGDLPLVHSGQGEHSRRSIMLASTLWSMPLGLAVFGKRRPGLKLAVIDRPRRLIWAIMPALLRGWEPGWLGSWGYHRVDSEGFDIALDDEFILDGEIFPAGSYRVEQGPPLRFQTPAP